jgi:hypothetical protein
MPTAVEKHNGHGRVRLEERSTAVQGGRIATSSGSLDDLVGAHPDALEKIYRGGRPADPLELGEAPRGRVLALDAGPDLFLLTRPLLRAIARSKVFPWQGKVFDHGGNAGQNVFFGRHVLRFRADRGPSGIDGEPTLRLFYDSAAFGNPWPVRSITDELRRVGPRLAIGPAFVTLGSRSHRFLWWGLERT